MGFWGYSGILGPFRIVRVFGVGFLGLFRVFRLFGFF